LREVLLIAQNYPRLLGGGACVGRFYPPAGPHNTFEEVLMEKFVYTSGALKKYLHARARGATPEHLAELSAQSLVEQGGPRLRLVVSNDESVTTDNETPDLVG
jgi:hypothetical protein